MKRTHLLGTLTFALSLVPVSAFAQNAGDPCGDVTYEGSCNGDNAVFCNNPDPMAAGAVIEVINCNEFYPGEAMGTYVSGECVNYPGLGAYCAAVTNNACLFSDGQGGLQPFACATDGSNTIDASQACVDGSCEGGHTACTPPGQNDPAPAPVCEGNYIVVGCFDWGQKYMFDCTDAESVGGTGCTAGACVGIVEGGYCGDGFECAAGLTCDPGSSTCSSGTPVGDGDGDGDGSPVGDGDGDGDGNTGGDGDGDGDTNTGGDGDGDGDGDAARDDDPEEPAAGGLCSSTGAPTTALFSFLALGLLAIRRRR